ncbi:transposase, partial [Porphyromonas levii]
SSIFKAQVALAGLRGDETMQSLAKRYEVSPSKITEWMRELEEKAVQAFEKPSDSTKELKKREFDLSDGDFVRFSDNFQI